MFFTNIPSLAKHFHIYAVDRLASGMSGNPTSDMQYSYQGDVDFVYNFIQTLKLGKVHLVGHSVEWRSSYISPLNILISRAR